MTLLRRESLPTPYLKQGFLLLVIYVPQLDWKFQATPTVAPQTLTNSGALLNDKR